jgi:hypothetical protein
MESRLWMFMTTGEVVKFCGVKVKIFSEPVL